MLVVCANNRLQLFDIRREELLPLVPIVIGSRRTRLHAPTLKLGAHRFDPAGIGTQPLHGKAMRCQQELVDLLLPVHGELFSGQAYDASFDRSATRFIAACSVASRPRRLLRNAASSTLTITPSKNASTGDLSAASARSEAV